MALPDNEKNVLAYQTNNAYTVADALVDHLYAIGVRHVFGVPGGAIEPLYDALFESERRGRVAPVLARHESGAAFMADGYARSGGRLGVCCMTTGPGMTNALTGVANAYVDGVPLLCITAQTPLTTWGRRAFQESSCTGIPALQLMGGITRYNALISHPRQLVTKLEKAIFHAFRPTPGPVHLTISPDVMRQEAVSNTLALRMPDFSRLGPYPDPADVQWVYRTLILEKNPVLVVGERCIGCADLLERIAAAVQVPLVETSHGKGIVSQRHPMYRGVFGFAGHGAAIETVKNSSALIVIGASLDEVATNGWDTALLDHRKVVQIDEIESEFAGLPSSFHQILARLNYFLIKLSEQIPCLDTVAFLNIGVWTDREAFAKSQTSIPSESNEMRLVIADAPPQRVQPGVLMDYLSRQIHTPVQYFVDTGNSFFWAVNRLQLFNTSPLLPRRQRSEIRTSFKFGAMGWAIGSAVGAALSQDIRSIICITGDGSVLMNGQEISVAVQLRLPVVFIILNDGVLGTVMHGQRLSGAAPVAFDLPQVDFQAMMQAMGVEALVVKNHTELYELNLDDRLRGLSGPLVLDIRIDPEQVPPLGRRIATVMGTSQ